MAIKKKGASRLKPITRRKAVASFTITGRTSDFVSLDRLRKSLDQEKGIINVKVSISQVQQRKRRVSK